MPPRFSAILATTCLLWFATAAAQSPAPHAAPVELRFGDFFRSPVGPRGLETSDTLRRADGHTVRITGYMVQQDSPVPGRFMLTPRPVQMSEHADGDADDLPPATVMVYLDASQADWLVPYVRGLVSLSGRLLLARHEETDGRVSWVRLMLAPDAARAIPGAAERHAQDDTSSRLSTSKTP